MDKQEAINKIISLRKEIEDAKKREIELDLVQNRNEDWEEEQDRIEAILVKNPEYYEITHIATIDPDFYCVQQFDSEKFVCVCKELGVSPTKLMLR